MIKYFCPFFHKIFKEIHKFMIESTGSSGGSTLDFQAGGVRGSIPETGTNGNFLSTSTGSGGSEPSLNSRSHHKEVSDLQGRGYMSRGKLLGGFWVILRDLFVCTYSGRLSKPAKGREYKIIHT